uniref:Uncharacterized protein n=1 Tax=Mustela putorius furo TaxID=9669 RepID=M3Y964_MUSPF
MTRPRASVRAGQVAKGQQAAGSMDLPEESQWDETTCQLAVCQHPQCWATIRRIERGHPRILGPPCKTALHDEDKLPVLTTVNMADSCLWAKRHAHHHLSGFTFTRPRALLCPGAKFDSKLQGRPRKDLPDKDLIDHPDRSPKLSVLNLNETQLPNPQDVRNMVVIWIPEQPERHMSPAEKKPVLRSQDWMRRRMISTTGFSSLLSPCRKVRRKPLGMIVPPPSPIQFLEQQSVPLWNQFDMLPQDLLKDLLPNEGKTMPSLEMRTQLAMMKKKAPLEKSRPDSAISAKMFLTVHRLTLQRPALRYPKHSKKLYHNLNTEGHKKQQQWQQKQQQRKVKTPPKRQEAKKKSKNSGKGFHFQRSVWGHLGHRTLPSQESDKKQPQQTKSEEPTLRKVRALEPFRMVSVLRYCIAHHLKADTAVAGRSSDSEGRVLKTCSPSFSVLHLSLLGEGCRWNPELKLLRILQATDNEDEEDQLSESQSEESF